MLRMCVYKKGKKFIENLSTKLEKRDKNDIYRGAMQLIANHIILSNREKPILLPLFPFFEC